MVATDFSGALVVTGVVLVNLLEVVVAVGRLLLGFTVAGRLVKLGTCGVVTE